MPWLEEMAAPLTCLVLVSAWVMSIIRGGGDRP